jgi:hypothetical protein
MPAPTTITLGCFSEENPDVAEKTTDMQKTALNKERIIAHFLFLISLRLHNTVLNKQPLELSMQPESGNSNDVEQDIFFHRKQHEKKARFLYGETYVKNKNGKISCSKIELFHTLRNKSELRVVSESVKRRFSRVKIDVLQDRIRT